MVDGVIFLNKGKMYVIGMDGEKPVYYPITLHELKLMIKETEDKTCHVSAHLNTDKPDLHFPAENVMSAGIEE